MALVLTLLLHISVQLLSRVQFCDPMDCIAYQAFLSFNISVILDKSLAFLSLQFPHPQIEFGEGHFYSFKVISSLKILHLSV